MASHLIIQDEIPGAAVYGVQQVQYSVDGVSGRDFTAALTAAAFKHSVSIEKAAGGYVEVVRQRQTKVSELGEALSCISAAIANLPTGSKISNDDSTGWNQGLYTAATILNKYGISHNISTTYLPTPFNYYAGALQRRHAQKNQSAAQYERDKEDNNLQQDLVSLNSYLSKRDSAYSTAARLVSKSDNAAKSTIHNIS